MPDVSHDFGARLRQAREQRGVSLHDIADRTKISVMVLEALERNDVARLPGGIFSRAFVRGYAQEVGLDPEETVKRFLDRFPDESLGEPRQYEPNPEHIDVEEPPTFGRAWRTVAWSMPLVLVVAYFGFGGRLPWWGERGRPAAAPAPPQAQANAPAAEPTLPPPPPPPPTSSVPVPVATEPVPAAAGPVAAQDPGLSVPTTTRVPAVAQAAAAPAAVPADGDAAKVPAPAAGPGVRALPGTFRLTLVPRESCWVSVRADGASVFAGVMQAGERKELALRGDVSLTVGNAGGFDFLIDDQPGRSLGSHGQVVTARLNVENLKTLLGPR